MARSHPVRWPESLGEAAEIQRTLRSRLRLEAPRGPIRNVAGADVAYGADGRGYAGVVVMRLRGLEVQEEAWAAAAPRFPYVPGFLSFREGPVLLAAFAKLHATPDAILFDGQGLAHPRGFGLACHLGVLLDRPSVGCAKSRLVGEHEEPERVRGSWRPLRVDGEVVGVVLRSREGVAPLFVSPGHRMDLEAAVELVLRCCPRFRIPEPIRRAEALVNRMKSRGRVRSWER